MLVVTYSDMALDGSMAVMDLKGVSCHLSEGTESKGGRPQDIQSFRQN
jgi:hypothetical protein